MKRFQVIWTQEALDAVTAAWVAAPSVTRDAIVKAWLRIDDVLADDPENAGESRDYQTRVWFDFPLGVKFKVNIEKAEVRLLKVWVFNRKGK